MIFLAVCGIYTTAFENSTISNELKFSKNERHFTDYKDILELQNLNGLSLGETYCNDKAPKEFISNIAGSYFDDLKDLLKYSKYFSLFCDGTTDKSESEKEIITVKVLEICYPVVKYLKLEEPDNTEAEGILNALDHAFEMPDYKKKLVGFCTDGANLIKIRSLTCSPFSD